MHTLARKMMSLMHNIALRLWSLSSGEMGTASGLARREPVRISQNGMWAIQKMSSIWFCARTENFRNENLAFSFRARAMRGNFATKYNMCVHIHTGWKASNFHDSHTLAEARRPITWNAKWWNGYRTKRLGGSFFFPFASIECTTAGEGGMVKAYKFLIQWIQ